MAKGIQAKDRNGNVVSNVMEPSGTTQKLAMTGSSVQSTAFTEDVIVRIWCSTDVNYKLGSNPTATADDVPLTAKAGEQISVRSGWKIAAIAASGNFFITEYANGAAL